MQVHKDSSVIDLLGALESGLGSRAFDIVDHWEGDLVAIGIARPDNHGVLVYICIHPAKDNSYSVCLELPPQPGSEIPYSDAGSLEVSGIDELVEVIRGHFKNTGVLGP